MTTHAQRGQGAATVPGEETRGFYVYGILRSAGSVPGDLASVGDEETPVRTVSHGDIAAAISEVHLNRPLGTRDDLLAHEHVLDAIAAETTVLPIRFGAVVNSVDSVVDELLAPNAESFEAVLSQLDGTIQFAVRGRYVDSAHIREIVAESPEIRELRESLRGVSPDAGYDARLKLGEMVSNAVTEKRALDLQQLVDAVANSVVATAERDVGGEDDAFDVAMLVERDRREDFESSIDALGDQWSGRVQLRLVGPLAPYDFLPEE
ncbi:Gas vesicle synthesis protein GvpL/GvpF [Saccharopolyspora kobensis]|uniref:Gas vesicle synthesis protein GvpL/GvpF n=1 Tax=Saccharopolyspora kobensis TaxID=146035 RepID=A0A1H6ACL9_9PSEU|nr:GvpL/GvpF family gas vesicle protein [Saccharopolyspora kobensis]SEG46458.1 Gas vesicle synthesis protein GvpL/GvpF [Saccharopolyspora kobensis]SFE54614.1 Gas vesicle synthesis protein GvpL/GvpF [Saccharopolyspora kobensis]